MIDFKINKARRGDGIVTWNRKATEMMMIAMFFLFPA